MASSYNELFGLGTHSEDANLEGWWPLQDDAASTTVDDASSNALDGTLGGGNNTSDLSTTGPNSWLTKALDFDGSSDQITFSSQPTPTLSSPWTVAMRVNADTTSGVDYAWRFYISTPEFVALGQQSGAYKIASQGETPGAGGTWSTSWITAILSYDGTSISLYIDGSLEYAVTPVSNDWQTATDSQIGPSFDGLLADFTLFSDEWTSAERTQWINGPEPVNSVVPAITGTETQGETLTSTTGTWGLDAPFSGGSNGTITYAYQWTRSNDGTGTGEADISGATSSTYTLTASDVGKYIRCRVAASNNGGNDSAADTSSSFTGAIASSGGGPTIRQGLQDLHASVAGYGLHPIEAGAV